MTGANPITYTERERAMSQNEYQNPFRPKEPNAVFRNDAKCVREYKGYRVYKIADRAYDIVKDGVCITQRCGHSKELIDRIDRNEDLYTSTHGPRHH